MPERLPFHSPRATAAKDDKNNSRASAVNLGKIDDEDIADALRKTVEDGGKRERITADDALRGVARARQDLERQILIPTWASLSAGHKAFFMSLVRGNAGARAIASDMEKKPNYVSKYKQRLLEQGAIEQDAYARLSFSLPGFADFVASQ